MLATVAIPKPRLRDGVGVEDQCRHTTVGSVRSRRGLLRAGNLLGRHGRRLEQFIKPGERRKKLVQDEKIGKMGESRRGREKKEQKEWVGRGASVIYRRTELLTQDHQGEKAPFLSLSFSAGSFYLGCFSLESLCISLLVASTPLQLSPLPRWEHPDYIAPFL